MLNPRNIWKLSPIDYSAMACRDDYTSARDEMLADTDRPPATWTVMLADDLRRTRVSIIRHDLSTIDYAGKDESVVRRPGALVLGGLELIGSK